MRRCAHVHMYEVAVAHSHPTAIPFMSSNNKSELHVRPPHRLKRLQMIIHQVPGDGQIPKKRQRSAGQLSLGLVGVGWELGGISAKLLLCGAGYCSLGLILKEPFNDFDRHNNGRVTPAQFRRCFPFGLTEVRPAPIHSLHPHHSLLGVCFLRVF